MVNSEQKTTQVNVCAWCKEQIKESEVDAHAGKCDMIPEDQKQMLQKAHQSGIETIEAEPREKQE